MRDRGWSRVRLFEEVGAELGYAPKSRSAILPFLEDKEPPPAVAAVFRRHFGDPPAEPEPVVVESPPADLATAILALTDELRERRQERVEQEARLRALEAEVRSLREQLGDAGSRGQSAPDGTAESAKA
jgi:hypothetical protein